MRDGAVARGKFFGADARTAAARLVEGLHGLPGTMRRKSYGPPSSGRNRRRSASPRSRSRRRPRSPRRQEPRRASPQARVPRPASSEELLADRREAVDHRRVSGERGQELRALRCSRRRDRRVPSTRFISAKAFWRSEWNSITSAEATTSNAPSGKRHGVGAGRPRTRSAGNVCAHRRSARARDRCRQARRVRSACAISSLNAPVPQPTSRPARVRGRRRARRENSRRSRGSSAP